MTKPFNIHDWQAKQRLTEAGMDTPGGNPDYFYDKDSIFGKLKDDPNFIKKVNAKNSKKDVSESLNPEVSRSLDKFIILKKIFYLSKNTTTMKIFQEKI